MEASDRAAGLAAFAAMTRILQQLERSKTFSNKQLQLVLNAAISDALSTADEESAVAAKAASLLHNMASEEGIRSVFDGMDLEPPDPDSISGTGRVALWGFTSLLEVLIENGTVSERDVDRIEYAIGDRASEWPGTAQAVKHITGTVSRALDHRRRISQQPSPQSDEDIDDDLH